MIINISKDYSFVKEKRKKLKFQFNFRFIDLYLFRQLETKKCGMPAMISFSSGGRILSPEQFSTIYQLNSSALYISCTVQHYISAVQFSIIYQLYSSALYISCTVQHYISAVQFSTIYQLYSSALYIGWAVQHYMSAEQFCLTFVEDLEKSSNLKGQ